MEAPQFGVYGGFGSRDSMDGPGIHKTHAHTRTARSRTRTCARTRPHAQSRSPTPSARGPHLDAHELLALRALSVLKKPLLERFAPLLPLQQPLVQRVGLRARRRARGGLGRRGRGGRRRGRAPLVRLLRVLLLLQRQWLLCASGGFLLLHQEVPCIWLPAPNAAPLQAAQRRRRAARIYAARRGRAWLRRSQSQAGMGSSRLAQHPDDAAAIAPTTGTRCAKQRTSSQSFMRCK